GATAPGSIKLFVTDFLSHKVRAITNDGNFLTLMSGFTPECFALPNSCAHYPQGIVSEGNQIGLPHFAVAQAGAYTLVDGVLRDPGSPDRLPGWGTPVSWGPGFEDSLTSTGQYGGKARTGVLTAVTSAVADASMGILNDHLAGSRLAPGNFPSTNE